jgi:CRP-like cAMP-binding protein
MDVHNHGAALAVKVQDAPRFACALSDSSAEKTFPTANTNSDHARVKAHPLDPGNWFAKLLGTEPHHEYLIGELIFSQGELADAVFYVQRGAVQLSVRSAEGEQAVTSFLQEGSFVGECCLVGQTVRLATASALLPSTVVRIERQAMTDLIHDDPEFAEHFLKYTLSRSVLMEANLIDCFFDSI